MEWLKRAEVAPVVRKDGGAAQPFGVGGDERILNDGVRGQEDALFSAPCRAMASRNAGEANAEPGRRCFTIPTSTASPALG